MALLQRGAATRCSTHACEVLWQPGLGQLVVREGKDHGQDLKARVVYTLCNSLRNFFLFNLTQLENGDHLFLSGTEGLLLLHF